MRPTIEADAERIKELAAAGFHLEAIAEELGQSPFIVRRVAKRTGVVIPRKLGSGRIPAPRVEAQVVPPAPQDIHRELVVAELSKHRPSPTDIAKVVWGNRLRDPSDGYQLDGVTINLTRLMQKTNERLVAWGLEQIVTNAAWRVEQKTVARSEES